MARNVTQVLQKVIRRELARSRRGSLGPIPIALPQRSVGTQIPSPSSMTAPSTALYTGGEVIATTPPSFDVIQTPLTGLSKGVAVQMESIMQIKIPYNNLPRDFYITIPTSGMAQVTTTPPNRNTLVTAIVHMPYEDCYEIRTLKPDDLFDHVGWIEPVSEGIPSGEFMVDSNSTALQNAIREILGAALVGQITLTDNLTIVNSLGTVRIDGTKMEIFDGDGKVRARFDEDSVDFYSPEGTLLAQFGAEGAEVGDIRVTDHSIESKDYEQGVQGFQVLNDGNAEFDNLVARGSLTVPEFDVLSYESGTTTFAFQRRRHLIEDLTVSHNDIIEVEGRGGLFDGTPLTDHKNLLVPVFTNQPVVILRENLVTVWDGSVMTGSDKWFRRFYATAIQSGDNAGKWNAVQFYMNYQKAGAGSPDKVYTGSNLDDSTLTIAPSSDTVQSQDAYCDPTTVSIPDGASGDTIQVKVKAALTGAPGWGESATKRFDFDIRVGTLTGGSISPVETLQSFSIEVSADSGFTEEVSSTQTLTFGSVSIDRTVKVDWTGVTTVYRDPPTGPIHFTQGADMTRVTYRMASGGSVEITNAVVDMEITED